MATHKECVLCWLQLHGVFPTSTMRDLQCPATQLVAMLMARSSAICRSWATPAINCSGGLSARSDCSITPGSVQLQDKGIPRKGTQHRPQRFSL